MTQKCIKCRRFGHVVTCDGCQQSFCVKHITEHREELSRQMSKIDSEYRAFEGDLNGNDCIQSYLSRIDQ